MRKILIWLVALLTVTFIADVGLNHADAQMGFGRFGGGFGGGFGGYGFNPRGYGQRNRSAQTSRGTIGGGRVTNRGRGGAYAYGRPERGSGPQPRPGRVSGRRPPWHVGTLPPQRRQPVFIPPIVQGGPMPQNPSAGTTPKLTSNGAQGGSPPPPSAVQRNGRAFDLPQPDERRYVPNEVLVTTVGQVSTDQLQPVERRLGLTLLASAHLDLLDADVRRYRLSDNSSVRGSISALGAEPIIKAAQPNFLFELQGDTPEEANLATKSEGSDTPKTEDVAVEPLRPAQYAIGAMKLDGAHNMATGTNVLIAIIDTGLDETHPEILGRIADRFDAVGGVFRAHSHGTAMAGVIVAHKDLVGIAPDARLLAIRAFESMTTGSGQGTGYDIIRGLDFAAKRGARIVNMSFAGPRDALLTEALAKARDRGMIEIAAAGNAGPDAPPLYPGAEPGVIAITATDANNRLFAMANRGDYVAVAAPGVDILAPSTSGAMQLTSGTSVAAAEASGVIALLLQAQPSIGADDVRRILGETATQVPEIPGRSTELIDAFAALQAMAR